jgi:hypothetical protein
MANNVMQKIARSLRFSKPKGDCPIEDMETTDNKGATGSVEATNVPLHHDTLLVD